MIKKTFFLIVAICLLCGGCLDDNTSRDSTEVSKDDNTSVDSMEVSKTGLRLESGTHKVRTEYSAKALASKFMDEKRIYLIDLTKSMKGFKGADDIFENVKKQLISAISELSDTTIEIVLIPFTDKPLDMKVNKISKKDEIIKYITDLDTKSGDTNIFDAWNKGVEQLDSTRINYMFMLTDGVHNYGKPIEDLYQKLEDWHNITDGKYQFAFYVLLSPNAREKEICDIVESSKQMWLVPSMNIHTDFVVGKMNVGVNIKNSNRIKIHLSCTNPEIFNEGFSFKLSIPENEFYRLKNVSGTLDSDGNVTFEIEKLKPQKNLPINYSTKLKIDYDKIKYPFVFFTPDEYNFNIANVGTRIMKINKAITKR